MSIDEVEQGAEAEGLFEHQVVALPSDDTVQWRAALLQLVNWGGFGGLTSVPLRGDATMISGASGVGKSTILDAYTALMMPSDTKFNGASNDAVAGRARGAGQRNLLSYLRGAVDVVDDPRTGRPVEQLLRGRGSDTWGAVAMTFVNDRGGRFTVLRTYYVPRRATRSGEVQMQLATHESSLSLETLELAVPERFHATTLKKLFPGLRVHRTYAEFSAVLHARLGIGANGDGSKALRLLARIQAGNQVRSVDELYKEMVLERPATYAAADRAVEHFDDLDAAHAAMRTAEEKLEVLGGIDELHARRGEAAARLAELDAYGVTASGDTPLRLWLLRTHAALLRTAVEENREARRTTSDQLAGTVATEQSLGADLEAAKEAHRAAGGSTLQSLALAVEQEQVVREDRLERRAALQERLLPLVHAADAQAPDLDSALLSAEAFATLQLHARQWLAGWERGQVALRRDRDGARDRRFPLSHRQSELRRERDSLQGRAGRVPDRMDQMRREVARASGLEVAELPFLAELVDVAPEHARWRTAVETVLGGSARTLLVPLDRLERFSSAIDGLQLRGRLTFEGVELDLPRRRDADPDRVAGKLLHADSPFTGWVQAHVAEPSRDALCVETPEELSGSGLRVTVAGQTRNGRRGSHGRNDARSIIGFTSADALAEIAEELGELERDLAGIDAEVAELDRRTAALEKQRGSYDALASERFDRIDVDGCDRRIAELERRRAEILSADDRLQALDAQIAELAERLEVTRRERYALDERSKQLNAAHLALVESEDEVTDALAEADEREAAAPTPEQEAALAGEFAAAAAPADPADLDRFAETAHRLHEHLGAAVADADAEIRRVDDELVAVFRLYQVRWPSPNLGTTPDSYGDYAAVLDDVRGKGLADRRAEWRRRLTEWSGQDLVPLLGAMAASVEEIEDRLDPINAILRRLEFGAARDRLRIRLRRLAPAHVQVFLKDLRALTSSTVDASDETALEQRFVELSRFMEQLRLPSATGAVTAGPSDRDRLLDVRRHVEISAERYDHLTGELRATYRTLGEKSGGESQELVAFIVGSALRFRLGDELRSRPRFAPVFLDEGFVKADSEFAGRAVRAWKGLGFQLVIGVPLDKVTGLEPHMDDLLAITKNSATHQAWITPLRDARAAAEETARG
ncbi:ATP-binding protein [Nocardioides zeae]|uniref:ATP-binding protein n=1 Tax=Nocardioides imazamoxiresistens TaxID=3231893 RepID=A0ABU3PWY3_9ACTN|nr:SbcC/MukB-like Walker B domain-containing protein [Nocardioides zeae]MDT9593739.1 ATP-binding protein [Nocardioides zeae]